MSNGRFKSGRPIKIYFSDHFDVEPETLRSHGAFNVSPVVDLPLFIDPFLLFTSDKPVYKGLHESIIRYLRFLRLKSEGGGIGDGELKAWYCFPEVYQNCLGFCETGNRGAGLGLGFARSLNQSLSDIFKDFGEEQVTQSPHLEKLVLICNRVGRDKISDFTTNLIKGFLIRYTEDFSKRYIKPELRKRVRIPRADFDYEIGVWKDAVFELPWLHGDYVLLTPEDILTKDDTWINKEDLRQDFLEIRESIDNDSLRAQVNVYFESVLKKDKDARGRPKPPTEKQENEAVEKTLRRFAVIIDYYIRQKERNGNIAVERSRKKVNDVDERFVQNISYLAQLLADKTDFYRIVETTLEEAIRRVEFLKHVIENQDGYRLFYGADGKPFEREKDLQIMFKLVCIDSPSSIDAEVNNGRGPVDFKVSQGSRDATLIEFKLASNSQLERNLQNQVEIYEKANRIKQSLKVVLFFSEDQEWKVIEIMKKLKVGADAGIVLIDARRDNKPSASKA